jgi:hypothetical protein
MALSISTIKGIGDLTNERVVLIADSETDIGKYLLLQTMGDEQAIYALTYASFWFPDKMVEEGDYVVLYTKKGSQKNKDRSDGKKTHFFYWDKMSPIWNKQETGAALCRIADYKRFLTAGLVKGDDAED